MIIIIRLGREYLYHDEIVTVTGLRNIEDVAETRYIVRWTTSDGTPHEDMVTASELRLAPTLTEMKQRYDEALQIICQQANRIEALEGERDRALELNKMNRAERDRMYTVIQRYRLETGILS